MSYHVFEYDSQSSISKGDKDGDDVGDDEGCVDGEYEGNDEGIKLSSIDGREDGRRVEVCIDASNRAMEREQGQNQTGREDLEDKDTWFDPLCGTIRRATRLARLQRRSVCVCMIVRIKHLLVIES